MIKIVSFDPALASHFEALNVEWLEKYFNVEPIDRRVLENPQSEVIDHGGDILFALLDDDVVGTCALKHHGAGVFELTKMAVTSRAQGHGLGRKLLDAAIRRFKELVGDRQGKRLYLESHHSLAPALKLYESGGFEHEPRPPGPELYERSDVYMVYRGEPKK
ncbi:MAG: GNAT family N-acetyltransferase [Gammaproteobacteria bacterium]